MQAHGAPVHAAVGGVGAHSSPCPACPSSGGRETAAVRLAPACLHCSPGHAPVGVLGLGSVSWVLVFVFPAAPQDCSTTVRGSCSSESCGDSKPPASAPHGAVTASGWACCVALGLS